MFQVLCPYCHTLLQVDTANSGENVKCVRCGKTFMAPDLNADQSDKSNAISIQCFFLIMLGGHVAGWLFLSLLVGTVWSTAIAALSLIAVISFYQRENLFGSSSYRYFEMNREPVVISVPEDYEAYSEQSSADVDSIQNTNRPNNADTDQSYDSVKSQLTEEDDFLIEIQAESHSSARNEAIQHSSYDQQTVFRDKPLNLDLPENRVVFFGPSTSLDLGRGVLRSALVYATKTASGNSFDSSLVDSTLPVAPPNQSQVDKLPYWPCYYESSPKQRSRYLDWLVGGRCDPDIELGYVFIYFYGLERRILIDDADHIPIIEEVIRLCGIYNHSNSFRNYSSALLWLTILLAGRLKPVSEQLIAEAICATERWHENVLGMCLAYHHIHNLALPFEVAIIIAQNDPRSRSSVIVKRHKEEFRKLFNRKYQTKFRNGLIPRASKRLKKIAYMPASSTLLRMSEYGNFHLPENMPNVLAISSQFKPVLAIWEECITDLRVYSRACRASAGEQMTAEAYEALPEELRDGNHPEEDAWMDLWNEYADENGWPLVPVYRLAKLKGIEPRDRLTKPQSARILATADALGIGVEPDARLTGRSYRWKERISPFFLETNDAEDMTSYHAAAVLLRLGLSVSSADGQIDQDELGLIANHLESQFDLSKNQSKRLEQLKYLLVNAEEADNTISTILTKRLPHNQRLLVGKFLVGIAAADQIVTSDEVRALRAAYRALELELRELDQLLLPYSTANTRTTTSNKTEPKQEIFRLDMETVSSIMAETKEVAAILYNVIAEDEEENFSGEARFENASMSVPQPTNKMTKTAIIEPDTQPRKTTLEESPMGFNELPPRFQPFFCALIENSRWTRKEAAALAHKHGVMLAGTIEAINEWSCEHFDDWLIEEDNGLIIRVDLLEGNE